MQIDNTVPPPPIRKREQRIDDIMAAKIDAMEINDSVVVEEAEVAICVVARIRNSGRKAVRRLEAGGYRIWRIA